MLNMPKLWKAHVGRRFGGRINRPVDARTSDWRNTCQTSGVFAAFAIAAALAAGPAAATATITCTGPAASVSLGIGTLPVLAIVSARIEAEGAVRTLEGAGEGAEVVVGQAARTDRWTIVDFTDPRPDPDRRGAAARAGERGP